MHIISLILVLSISIGAYAEPQFLHGNYGSYFRAGIPQPSYDVQQVANEPRFLLKTVTLTWSTATVFSTTTTTTTCTTSTSVLSQCSASGRRRRSALDGNRSGKLFYGTEDEEDSVFLPVNM